MKKMLFISLVLSMLLTMVVLAAPTAVESFEPAQETNSEFGVPELSEPEISQNEAMLMASSGTCGTNLTWTFDSEGTLTISGSGAMKNWYSYSNAPWYSNRESIKNVVIGNSVTSIGKYAFYNCTSLASITIGNSVTSIGSNAFEYCTSLTSVYANSVSAWCNIVFDGYFSNPLCSSAILYIDGKVAKNIEIPDGTVKISSYAFCNCKTLESITIPDSVTIIGDYAFSGCSSLTSITIPDSVTSIGEWAFSTCSSLTSITIPDSVISIGNYAFSYCYSLEEATILSRDVEFGSSMVALCSKLTIYGYAGSTSETYAKENDIPFIAIEEPSYTPGELDGNGIIDVSDAILLLQYSMFPDLYPRA